MKHTSRWQWGLFLLLQLLNLYQIVTHAMWRDELQTWSMVLESNNLTELFHNMRYDGFPPLWHLSLWVLSFISLSPLTMQLFHFACSLMSQSLVMIRAPFSANMRLIIVSGYYISFEYCIISRAYVLGVLLLFLYCAFKDWLMEHPFFKGCIFGLLANTSVYGAIISLALVVDGLWSAFNRRNEIAHTKHSLSVEVWRFMASYSSFFIVAVVFMIPPDDVRFAQGWNLFPSFSELFFLLIRNLLFITPIPIQKIDFWNSLAVIDAGIWLSVPVSLGILFAIWYALKTTPRYLGLFFIGFTGIWAFTAMRYLGYLRHVGSAMILFIVCIWLSAVSNEKKQVAVKWSTQIAIWSILIPNFIACWMASFYILKYDFSGSREMAQIIQDSGKNSYPIVADIDYAASSVAGYLGKPLYYVSNHKKETFIRWNSDRDDSGNPLEALRFAGDLAVTNNGQALLLLNYPIESIYARLIAKTREAIVANEVFYLYEYIQIKPDKQMR